MPPFSPFEADIASLADGGGIIAYAAIRAEPIRPIGAEGIVPEAGTNGWYMRV